MSEFILNPFLNQWFHWNRIDTCFWPGAGKRSLKIDPDLSPAKDLSGIYVIAWGNMEGIPDPASPEVQYIGLTNNFKRRMEQFASSAGLHYDDKYSGHSAAWNSWPIGKYELMNIAFFPISESMAPHVESGFLHWQEALAIDKYYKVHNRVPSMNAGNEAVIA